MRRSGLGRAIGVLALGLAATPAFAQSLKLSGPHGQSQTLTAPEIAALPHIHLSVTVEGKTAAYDGVPLTLLLQRVGAPAGKALHGAALRDVVLVQGKDGYAAAFALAETDAGMRKDQILLADRVDGQPLPDATGPFRLVVEGDLRAARSVRMVTGVEVRTER
jgi:DMSO/TMAO reductase YedYZ molybdopterin-dependent catalytic subunit